MAAAAGAPSAPSIARLPGTVRRSPPSRASATGMGGAPGSSPGVPVLLLRGMVVPHVGVGRVVLEQRHRVEPESAAAVHPASFP